MQGCRRAARRGSTCSQVCLDARKEQRTTAGPTWRLYVLAVMLKNVITSLASSALFPSFCCSGFPSPYPPRIQLQWCLTNWKHPYQASGTGLMNCTLIKATPQRLPSAWFGQPSASLTTSLSLQHYLRSARMFFQGPFISFCLPPRYAQIRPVAPSSLFVSVCLCCPTSVESDAAHPLGCSAVRRCAVWYCSA